MWDKLLGVAFALLACGGAALGVLLLRWRSRHLSPAVEPPLGALSECS